MALSLQKASLSVEMKRRPATGPAVVNKEHQEAFNICSPSPTLKILRKILCMLPTHKIFAPMSLRVSEILGSNLRNAVCVNKDLLYKGQPNSQRCGFWSSREGVCFLS
ncbi:hypothetical protein Ancab_029161 [Ancistrocladus abbreviatus]